MFKQLQSFDIYFDTRLRARTAVDFAQKTVVSIACVFAFKPADFVDQPSNQSFGTDARCFVQLNFAVSSHCPEAGMAQIGAHGISMRLECVIDAER